MPVTSPLRRFRRHVAAALATLAAALSGANAAVQHVEQPRYVATALIADPGSAVARDANVIVWADGPEVQVTTGPASGHAALPRWQASLGPLPDFVLPFAPALGWPVDGYMRPIARGERGLRVCADELRAFDRRLADVALQAVRDSWDALLDIPPTQETCADPDLVLGLGAESPDGGCGTPRAVGCAALLPRPGATGGYYTRVTLNGQMARAGQYSQTLAYWTIVHEAKHAMGYGHTGAYGGEAGAHPHPSDLGYLCGERPCDNPTGRPAREDYEDQPGHNTVWGLRFRGAATATPTPTPTPTPLPGATLRLWTEAGAIAGRCPGEVWYGDWCVVTVAFRGGAEPRAWLEWHEGEFDEVRP